MSGKKKVVIVSENGHGHIPGKVEEGLLRQNERKSSQKIEYILLSKTTLLSFYDNHSTNFIFLD